MRGNFLPESKLNRRLPLSFGTWSALRVKRGPWVTAGGIPNIFKSQGALYEEQAHQPGSPPFLSRTTTIPAPA